MTCMIYHEMEDVKERAKSNTTSKETRTSSSLRDFDWIEVTNSAEYWTLALPINRDLKVGTMVS